MRGLRLAAILLGLLASVMPLCAQHQATAQREATAEDVSKIPPLPPPRLIASCSAKGEVALQWTPSKLESVVAYKVYRKEGDGDFKFMKEVKAPSFVDKHAPEGDVQYAVTSVDSRSGESKLSKPAKKPN